jgi:hypothetical protein
MPALSSIKRRRHRGTSETRCHHLGQRWDRLFSRACRPYRLTARSCPAPAGRLRSATSWGDVEQLQAEERHHVANDDLDQKSPRRRCPKAAARGELNSKDTGDQRLRVK